MALTPLHELGSTYGVQMNEPLGSYEEIADLRESIDHTRVVEWDDPDLVEILRFRLIGCTRSPEYPFWDISYCYGRLRTGERCRVDFPFQQLPRNWKPALVARGREAGVYVKGLGFFDAVSQLWG
jgi:hypothetical protein